MSRQNPNNNKNPTPQSDVVSIDVGGQLFQTTKQTLTQSGPNSLFSQLAGSDPTHRFIDRDPALFFLLLSLLRTGTSLPQPNPLIWTT